jgi:hypothetical protein
MFPAAQMIVPSHGNAGNRELLEYTIGLFEFAQTIVNLNKVPQVDWNVNLWN